MSTRYLKFSIKTFSLVVVALVGLSLHGGVAHATYNSSDLVSDDVFTNYHSMGPGDIQTFLSNHGSGLTNYSEVEDCGSPSGSHYSYYQTYYHCGVSEKASQIIYDASQAYQINPEAILATLQKEQSLVTDPNPDQATINCAMGYDSCSDDNSFFLQVDNATWQFRLYMKRLTGDNTWWNPNLSYPCNGPTSLYSAALRPGNTVTFADPYYGSNDPAGPGQGARTITLNNAATAGLYCYTPYVGPYSDTGYSGSYNFVVNFENWFGSTVFSTGSVTMNVISQPDLTPAVGETVTYVVSFTNNLSDSITLDAVGIVGRLGNVNTGANRDFGWQGPVTFTAGQTKQFTFTTLIQDKGTLYVWPAINYQGVYQHFNNWGAALQTHMPNLSLTSPLSSTITSPVAGQTATLSATVKNNENVPINIASIGIPVRYYGTYNYDTAWVSPAGSSLAAGASQALSGTVTFDKAGPYTAWVSAVVAGQFTTLSPVMNFNAAVPTPNFALSYTATPDTNPVLGEAESVQFNLTNNSGVPMTLDAVGVVGRYDNPFSGPNKDFGWVGPVSFAAGQTKSFTSFATTITDLNTYYVWPAINYQGRYIHYNNWGFQLTPHLPNLTTNPALSINNGSPPPLGQSVPVSVTIKNLESKPVSYSAVGIPARFYGRYNYDVTWQGAGTLAAAGQSGDSLTLSGTMTFDKHGPYTVWPSILIAGRYITIGNVTTINE